MKSGARIDERSKEAKKIFRSPEKKYKLVPAWSPAPCGVLNFALSDAKLNKAEQVGWRHAIGLKEKKAPPTPEPGTKKAGIAALARIAKVAEQKKKAPSTIPLFSVLTLWLDVII